MKKKNVVTLRFMRIRNREDSNQQEIFEVIKRKMVLILPDEYKEFIGKKIIAIEPMDNLFPDGRCILITVA